MSQPAERPSLEGAFNRIDASCSLASSQVNLVRAICGQVFGGFPEEPKQESGPIGTSLLDRLHTKISELQREQEKINNMLHALRENIGDCSPMTASVNEASIRSRLG